MRGARSVLSSVVVALAVLCSPGIHSASSADPDLRVAIRMDSLWLRQLVLAGYREPLVVHAHRSAMARSDDYWRLSYARFFSFAVYDNAPVSTGLADHLFDQEIAPDPGSANPFVSPGGEDGTYTLTVTRGQTEESRNVLRLDANTGWLLYRLYLPNAGEGSMAGVPLPSVSITDAGRQSTDLPTCTTVNRQSELAALQPQFVPALSEDPPLTPRVPDRIWFAPLPAPPPQLLPNPDNKYMVSFFMSEYEQGRIIEIRVRCRHSPTPIVARQYRSPRPVSTPSNCDTGRCAWEN